MLTIAAKIVRAKIPIQGGWVEPHHSKGGVKHQGGLRQRNWRPPPWIFGAKDRKDRKEWKAWVIDKERKMNTCIYICTYYTEA